MQRVEHYERIRRLVLVEGWSQRQAARELGVSRKTVKKVLANAIPPGYVRKEPSRRPQIDRVKGIIDAWLVADQQMPRKQRHTGARIWQRLKEEYGFTGGVSAVRRYVAHQQATGGEVFMPLQFEPGEEAQTDWGEAWVELSGQQRKVQLFCTRLCFSTVSFVRAYEDESTESLLDGHVRAFEFFGGVPRRETYDNASTMVVEVGAGQERKLTRRFMELKSFYLFETRFCNVASGNEKGHVENLVKHAQRTFMTPLPQVVSLEELNAHLLSQCQRELDEPAIRTGRTRRELLEEERKRFLPLPAGRFETCRYVSTLANKLSLVRFAGNDYSVPVAWAHHQCVAKGFVDRVEICSGREVLARHARSYGQGEYVLDWQHYVPLLERKPGALNNGRPFKGEPWGPSLEELRRELVFRYDGAGVKKFVEVLLLFTEFPVERVKDAVGQCVRRCAFSPEAVRSVLTYEPPRKTGSLDLSGRPELAGVGRGTRDLGAYDALLAQAVSR
jgi:transposase